MIKRSDLKRDTHFTTPLKQEVPASSDRQASVDLPHNFFLTTAFSLGRKRPYHSSSSTGAAGCKHSLCNVSKSFKIAPCTCSQQLIISS